MIKVVKCPICGKNVEFCEEADTLPPNFPFCSRRCKLIDLGRWLKEEYSISEPLPEEYRIVDDDEG